MGPSSEAVEAAAEALFQILGSKSGADSPTAGHRLRARQVLAAALPIIRREIAEEIEAERLFDNTSDPADEAYQDAILLAAKIARGEVSR
jgi:hypothetical protein